MCSTLVAAVLLVPPSPKLQNRLLMVPLELSVKVTVNGVAPLVGLALNAAVTPGNVVALATLEYGLKFTAASVARTR